MFGIKKINPLANIANRDLIGVDFGGNALKMAHIRISPNKMEVINLLSRSIVSLSDTDIAKVISSSFQGLNVKNPEVMNVVTSNLAITKNIEIPSIDPKEIEEIINLQAGRHTPYSRDEIIIDYINMGTYKNTYTKILLVIVARNVIKRQFDILGRAGLKLEKVFFAPEGLALAVPKILNIETGNTPAGIINIDETFTDFTVVYKNRLVFVRSIPIGTQHLLDEKEAYTTRFAEELRRSLETYQNENIMDSPASLVLTGAIEEVKDLEPILNGAFHLPIRVIPYLRNLFTRNEALNAASAAKRQSFLNAIFPALASGQVKINLIPEEVKLKRSIEERGKDLIKTGIFVFTAFILICMILTSKIYFKTVYLKTLSTKYQALNQEAKKLEDSFTMVSLVRNYLSNRGYSLEVLTELHAVAPVELELDDIRFDDQGKVSIKGTAESMSTVFSFVETMGKSKYFKDVKTKYTSKRKEGAKDLTDFEIVSLLNRAHD